VTTPSTASGSASGISLSADDFDRLAGILATTAEFRTAQGRLDFLDDVFAGSPRRADVLALLNLDGAPRGVAVRVISRLTQFGQDEPGRETLGILINKLLGSYVGSGADAEFLRDLFARYPFRVDPLVTRPLDDDWRGRESPADVQEKIFGENTLRDVRLLELALVASRAVVRIRAAAGVGSGFLVGTDLIMTNNHVIPSNNNPSENLVVFNYQLDRQGKPAIVQAVGVTSKGLFHTNETLDYTVLTIDRVPEGVEPLTLTRKPVKRNERVNIIQHPFGHYKKISMQNNFVAYVDARTIQYLTATERGSSGSPVFNDDFKVVGIHHSGGELPEPGTNRHYLRNAGSSMIAVLEDLHENKPEIYQRLNLG
jgi:V8-like Glu-specific endopeptidase